MEGSAEMQGLQSCSHMLEETSSQKSIKVQVRAQGGLVETAGWPLASVAKRWRLHSSETHPRSASLTAQDPPNYLLQLPVELLEKILDNCSPRSLASLEATCNHFEASSCQSYARGRLQNLPKAHQVLIPLRGESWITLLEYADLQTKALAQGTTIGLGAHHSAALFATDTNRRGYALATFGRGLQGQLGDGSYKLASWTPKIIVGDDICSSLEPINISSDCKHCTEEAVQLHFKKPSQVVKLTYPAVISAGSEHTIALAASGSPYSWGLARLGALRQNNTTCQSSPKQLSRTHAERTVAAAAGSHHTMTLTETGDVFACGSNAYGQLGNSKIGRSGVSVLRPIALGQCGRGKFCSVAAGKHHSVALTHVGEIWTWGHGSFGQLGHAAEALSAEERPEHVSIGLCKPTLVAPLSPILLPMQDRVTAIQAGGNQTAAISVSGKLFVFGENKYGCLGQGHTQPVMIPTEVDFRRMSRARKGPIRVIQVAIGGDHIILLAHCCGEATVFAAGYNFFGQLGLGHWSDTNRFKVIRALSKKRVVSVAAGQHHSAAILEDRTLLMWGRNDSGQLGLGTDDHVPRPTVVPGQKIASSDITLRGQ